METHAHNLHKAPGNKFWHYFFEFFMLFIAVFCGFLAENFRERQVEKERGRQYIESFYEDLKTDTTRISAFKKFGDDKIEGLSNIAGCYDTVSKNVKATSCMLDLVKNTTFNRPFLPIDRTLKQLANAGGFRLLQKEDADSIVRYEKRINQLEDFQRTIYQEAQNNVRSTYNLLIDFKANNQMLKIQPGQGLLNFNKEVTMPILFSDDKMLLNKYFNELYLYYRVTISQQKILMDLKKSQTLLIEFFKNKYHFE